MKNRTCLFFVITFCLYSTSKNNHVDANEALSSFKQEWGYVNVREGAHMFWWLFYTTANVSNFQERPLIIWLQGGPGIPSSGFGNFIEIGPLDLELKANNNTWINDYNVLFLDNPVGVGFSYVTDNATIRYVKNNDDIGRDLVNFLKKFLEERPVWETIPLYIFGESYGGKMTVAFAHLLLKEKENGNVRVNLRGIGLGDAYISPIDYIMNYAPLSLALGIIDKHGFTKIDEYAKKTKKAVDEGRYDIAAKIESKTTEAVIEATKGIDIYNIALPTNTTASPLFLNYLQKCKDFMNDVVKPFLNISNGIEWSYISDDIYNALHADFIRPVTPAIAEILNTTDDVKVIVYNGIFDLIVNTPGTALWLDKLDWRGKQDWAKATQEIVEVNMVSESYVKEAGNLVFYSVLRAGHSVPLENPIAMKEILRREILEDLYPTNSTINSSDYSNDEDYKSSSEEM